jgi:hypothetical protein
VVLNLAHDVLGGAVSVQAPCLILKSGNNVRGGGGARYLTHVSTRSTLWKRELAAPFLLSFLDTLARSAPFCVNTNTSSGIRMPLVYLANGMFNTQMQ